jgi:hypothetical protein
MTGATAPTLNRDALVEAIGEGLRQWTIERNGGVITTGMKREMADCILRQPAFVAVMEPADQSTPHPA